MLKKYYGGLKEIFYQVSCQYRPPDIAYEDFLIFLRKAEVLDQEMHAGIIGVYFSVTNFEEEDQSQNDDKDLCRFEFMEILLRIAKGKFVDTGLVTSLSQAFEKLIVDHILPMNDKLVPWQKFRIEHMWNLPVSDLLMVNYKRLTKLYQAIATLRKFKKKKNKTIPSFRVATIDQVLAFLSKKLPGVFEKHIVRSFYLSKMTTIEPMIEGNH